MEDVLANTCEVGPKPNVRGGRAVDCLQVRHGCKVMQVKRLIELLSRFDPDADVHLSVALPGRGVATHENVWVADYGGGPQLIAALDPRHFHVYVGCGLGQSITEAPVRPFEPSRRAAAETRRDVDLGKYENEELAAKVRDFFNYHRRPGTPLKYPEFDYGRWIAPRTTSGEYNEHIAAILREKLLAE